MLVEPFIPFLLFVLALYATPGPATISIVASGATFGFKKTIAYIFGIVTGLVIIFLMVALGLGLIFEQYPMVHSIFKWVSLLYIFYLAYKIANASSITTNSNEQLGYLQGVPLSLLNPKAYFAVIATVTQFTKQGVEYYESFIILIIWIIILATSINFIWAYIGENIGRKLMDSGFSSNLNIVFAVLLVGSVLLVMVI